MNIKVGDMVKWTYKRTHPDVTVGKKYEVIGIRQKENGTLVRIITDTGFTDEWSSIVFTKVTTPYLSNQGTEAWY